MSLRFDEAVESRAALSIHFDDVLLVNDHRSALGRSPWSFNGFRFFEDVAFRGRWPGDVGTD